MRHIDRKWYIFIFILFLINACGDKLKKTRETIENLKTMTEVAENMQESLQEASERMEERRAKGDTLALHYEVLATYLPNAFNGYEKSDQLQGGSTTLPGLGSFSNVTQTYNNSLGDEVKITIADYNATYSMYMTLMAAFGAGFEVDTPEKRTKGFTITDDVKGWQEFDKRTKHCKVLAGISDRFFIEIEAQNQKDESFTKDILIYQIPLEEISKL